MTDIQPELDPVRATLQEVARHRAAILARFLPPSPEPAQETDLPDTGNLLPISTIAPNRPGAFSAIVTASAPQLFQRGTHLARLFLGQVME